MQKSAVMLLLLCSLTLFQSSNQAPKQASKNIEMAVPQEANKIVVILQPDTKREGGKKSVGPCSSISQAYMPDNIHADLPGFQSQFQSAVFLVRDKVYPPQPPT